MLKYERPTEVDEYGPEFDLFFLGYTQGIGFTSSQDDGEPLFGGQGDFDVTDPESWNVWSLLLTEGEREEILADAVSFFLEAREMIAGDNEKAGTDFHFTRNGHGTGFWDNGKWERYGSELTELSKPFGTLELNGVRNEDGEVTEAYLNH